MPTFVGMTVAGAKGVGMIATGLKLTLGDIRAYMDAHFRGHDGYGGLRA